MQIVNGVEPGVTGVNYGEITLSGDAESITVHHGLGVIPTQFFIGFKHHSPYVNYTDFAFYPYNQMGMICAVGITGDTTNITYRAPIVDASADSESITINAVQYHKFRGNDPYVWIAKA